MRTVALIPSVHYTPHMSIEDRQGSDTDCPVVLLFLSEERPEENAHCALTVWGECGSP